MARRLIITAVAALLLALPAPAGAASPLAGTSWNVKRVDGRVMPRREHSRMSFDARDFAAKFECNHGGGRYRVDGSRLRFSDIRSTAIGCEYPEGGAPPSLGDALLRTRSYRLTGRRLLLLGKRGRTIVRLTRRG